MKKRNEILIFTDDIGNYSKYRNILDELNLDINHRSSISEALLATRYRNFDLVIIDIDVPKFRTKHLKMLRKLKKRSNIINLVDKISTRALEECIKMECMVIKKPFSNTTLIKQVEMILTDTIDYKLTNVCLDDSPFCDQENYAEV